MRAEKWKELKSYIEELKTVSVKPALTGFLSTTGAYYHLSNGSTIYREKIERDEQHAGLVFPSEDHAIVVLPITQSGKCILTVEPKIYMERTVNIGFLIGYFNDEEHYLDVARRKLLEDVGYQESHLECLGEFYQDEGYSAVYNYGILATGCRPIKNQRTDTNQLIRYFLCDFEDVEELIDKKYILGANSQLIYEKARRLLKK